MDPCLFLEYLCDNFSFLVGMLDHPKYASKRICIMTGSIEPLGIVRLKICEFFPELIQVEAKPDMTTSLLHDDSVSLGAYQEQLLEPSYSLCNRLFSKWIESNVTGRLIDLFFNLEQNNFIHAVVVDLVVQLVKKILSFYSSDYIKEQSQMISPHLELLLDVRDDIILCECLF
jgi:hypothetical protein